MVVSKGSSEVVAEVNNHASQDIHSQLAGGASFIEVLAELLELQREHD